jgi:hypothetical protein
MELQRIAEKSLGSESVEAEYVAAVLEHPPGMALDCPIVRWQYPIGVGASLDGLSHEQDDAGRACGSERKR